ncbi:MAG: glycosyltransferase family 2 protein [Pseudomonadota bacterium]
MILKSLDAFSRLPRGSLGKGPLALIIAEDAAEISTTVAHLLAAGFRKLIILAPENLDAAAAAKAELGDWVTLVHHPTRQPGTATRAVNALIDIAPNTWLHYCFNGEFLFFPFSESRSVTEATIFAEEERRYSILTYVIDLYAGDLSTHPDAVSLETAYLDRAGYYAETRRNEDGDVLERQLNFFGGLRWRFEDHVAEDKRKIDRVGLFRSEPGLRLHPDHTLSNEELNTYACPWHNSMTAAICSFRVAKALRTNPGSRYDIDTFLWHRSERFEWSSQQLLDLGLMEPGQWF